VGRQASVRFIESVDVDEDEKGGESGTVGRRISLVVAPAPTPAVVGSEDGDGDSESPVGGAVGRKRQSMLGMPTRKSATLYRDVIVVKKEEDMRKVDEDDSDVMKRDDAIEMDGEKEQDRCEIINVKDQELKVADEMEQGKEDEKDMDISDVVDEKDMDISDVVDDKDMDIMDVVDDKDMDMSDVVDDKEEITTETENEIKNLADMSVIPTSEHVDKAADSLPLAWFTDLVENITESAMSDVAIASAPRVDNSDVQKYHGSNEQLLSVSNTSIMDDVSSPLVLTVSNSYNVEPVVSSTPDEINNSFAHLQLSKSLLGINMPNECNEGQQTVEAVELETSYSPTLMKNENVQPLVHKSVSNLRKEYHAISDEVGNSEDYVDMPSAAAPMAESLKETPQQSLSKPRPQSVHIPFQEMYNELLSLTNDDSLSNLQRNDSIERENKSIFPDAQVSLNPGNSSDTLASANSSRQPNEIAPNSFSLSSSMEQESAKTPLTSTTVDVKGKGKATELVPILVKPSTMPRLQVPGQESKRRGSVTFSENLPTLRKPSTTRSRSSSNSSFGGMFADPSHTAGFKANVIAAKKAASFESPRQRDGSYPGVRPRSASQPHRSNRDRLNGPAISRSNSVRKAKLDESSISMKSTPSTKTRKPTKAETKKVLVCI
jgi:hypothetical protein